MEISAHIVIIESWKSFQYVEVFEVTERRNGAIYKTARKGFAKASRTRKENEVYTALSTEMLKNATFEIVLLED